MPIYEYECRGCGARHEFIQKFSDRPKRKCPTCGKLRLRKLISAAAFHLKGDGWYVTDFRDKSKAREKTDSTESSGDSKPGPKSSDSKSTDSKSTDSKSAEKKNGAGSKASGGSVGSSQAA